MFKSFFMLIAKGLLTILPIALTVYLLVWIILSTEKLLAPHIPEHWYFPGSGIIVALIALALIGIAVNAYFVKWLINKFNYMVEKVPVVKTLFGAIKDGVELFQLNKERDSKKVVSVELAPGTHLIGFVTSKKVADYVFPNQGLVPVYLPLSYQIGGHTLYLSADKITELDIDVQTAMRIVVTGGNSISKNPK